MGHHGDMGLTEYSMCGAFGGMCTVIVGHPLDTIKVRLQSKPGEHNMYRGTFDCLNKTYSNEGFCGLYKGMLAPLVGVAPIFAFSFLGYKTGKLLFGPEEEEDFQYVDFFKAGAFSAIFTTVLMAPAERIKCLLQVQSHKVIKKYNGPIDVIRKLYKKGGIVSIYRGTTITLLRDVPSNGVFFLTYQYIQDILTGTGKTQPSIPGTIFAGGTAGVANWIIACPFDVVRTRIQTAPPDEPHSIFFVGQNLLKREGPLALYKGLIPVVLRAFPANAACFAGFEFLKSLIIKFLRNYMCFYVATSFNQRA